MERGGRPVAGVDDGHREPTGVGSRRAHRRHVRLARHVAAFGQHCRPFGCGVRSAARSRRSTIASRDHDRGAVGGKVAGAREPDARPAAGDEGNLSGERSFHAQSVVRFVVVRGHGAPWGRGHLCSARRHPRPRLLASPVGPARDAHARRPRRRGDQGRTARGRPHPVLRAATQRARELFRPAERREVEPQHRSRDRGRGGDHPRAVRARRRRRRELPTGRARSARARARSAPRAEPAADRRLDLRLRPDRTLGEAARVRPRRRGRVGVHRLAGIGPQRRTDQGPPQPRRRLHGHGDQCCRSSPRCSNASAPDAAS